MPAMCIHMHTGAELQGVLHTCTVQGNVEFPFVPRCSVEILGLQSVYPAGWLHGTTFFVASSDNETFGFYIIICPCMDGAAIFSDIVYT